MVSHTRVPATDQNPARRFASEVARVSLPSWVISVLLHTVVLVILGTITWTVSQAAPEREFSVGIVVKKDTPTGQVYEDQEQTYKVANQAASTLPDFLPEKSSTELSLPELPSVDLQTIGVSGPMISGVGELLAVPELSGSTGMVASTQFFGAQVRGTKFVYVIDRSGSMSQRDQMGAAKRELLASLDKLPAAVQFQIIFYNFQVEFMPSGGSGTRLLPATQSNKLRARRFLDTIVADGGTEHVMALEPALKLGPDVIFFLTDAQDMRDRDVTYITELNKGRTRIHAIEFGLGQDLEPETTLRELADKNGGTYRYVDVSLLGQLFKEAQP